MDCKYLLGQKLEFRAYKSLWIRLNCISASLPKISKAHVARMPGRQFAEKAEQKSRMSSKLKCPSCSDENNRYIALRNEWNWKYRVYYMCYILSSLVLKTRFIHTRKFSLFFICFEKHIATCRRFSRVFNLWKVNSKLIKSLLLYIKIIILIKFFKSVEV